MKGAHQVNLDVGDRPADVYSGVAAMANVVIDKECLEGNQYALLLKGKVTRKVVKQTVSLDKFLKSSIYVLMLFSVSGHDYCLWSYFHWC